MNRITKHFSQHPDNNLNVYFTAGYPALNDTMRVLTSLQKSGADLVEIGIPYSDPVADGETIQESDEQALNNGITLQLIFEQLRGMRDQVTLPVIMMGYINPVLQYGVENFCRDCARVGVDGVILPDLPLDVYDREFRHLFEKHGLLNLFLITPQTSEKRIRQIDEIGEGFIYMVSSASVTGGQGGISTEMEAYFNRVNSLQLRNPRLIGFGIKDLQTFEKACAYSNGAIIGSAFIRVLKSSTDLEKDIENFIGSIKPNKMMEADV